jgi:Flp pilus assembly protein TadD
MLDTKRVLAPLVALGMMAACAPPRPQPPSVGETPVERGAGHASAAERQEIENGYQELRAGKPAAAESRFRHLHDKSPKLLAAQTGLAYVRLRTGRYPEAEHAFLEVLSEEPDDFDALLGMGETAAKSGDLARSVAYYRRAAEGHPDDATARKRLSEAKLVFTESGLAAARAAKAAGNAEEAAQAYRHALEVVPEVSGLRVELATLLVAGGSAKEAIDVLAADPTADPQVATRLGELQMQAMQYDDAVRAFHKAQEKDPHNAEVDRRLAEAQQALEFSRMPEEYQRIFSAPYITRADLAALIDVKITALARAGDAEPKVAVDISGSWAKAHIIKALAFDIIGVYPNHTFQPAALVRRGDLARAVARVLDLLRWRRSALVAISDMTSSHLYYDAAQRAVGAGLMTLTPEGGFSPSERVSGRDAAEVIDALNRLVGP